MTYKIKTQPNIATGDIINNQAFIYFDANAPVATNIYMHTIGENLSTIFISTIQVIDNQNFSVKIIPNPIHDFTTITINTGLNGVPLSGGREFTLYNTLGQTVKTQDFVNEKLVLQRDDLPQGCYFYTITNNGQRIAQGRLVVQ